MKSVSIGGIGSTGFVAALAVGATDLISVLFYLVNLEDISFFKVAEFLETDTALVTLGNFLNGILESLERGHVIVGDNNTVADNSNHTVSGNFTLLNV